MASVSESTSARNGTAHDIIVPPEFDEMLDDTEFWSDIVRLASDSQTRHQAAVAALSTPVWPEGLTLFDDLDTIVSGLAEDARDAGRISDRRWRESHDADALARAYALLHDGYTTAAIRLADAQARLRTFEALTSDCRSSDVYPW